MDLLLLLGILIGGPIILVGSIQYLIFKLAGVVALRVVCVIVGLYCVVTVISAYAAPPILGNKAGYAALADGLTLILLLECMGILLWPLGHRYLKWEKKIDERRGAEAEKMMGMKK